MKTKSGIEFLIRKIEEKDAESVLHYLNQISTETDFLTFGEGELAITVDEEVQFIRKMNDNPNSVLLMVEIDGEIVAIGSLDADQKPRLKHNSLLGISVLKKYWNLGIATALLSSLIDFAKSNSTTKNINLSVSATNAVAIALYEKFGFLYVGTLKDNMLINQNYFDTILMSLKL